jgi:decaprenylphospho-beta-D-ribofuranose 2-oxidase
MGILKAPISGWGRYPVEMCEMERPERYADLIPHAESLIVRGQGRSYGDASLNRDRRVLLTERVNRFLAFDREQGILRAEAGVTLAEILQVIVPANWFLPVTPGTQFVSLGGAVAADVHGKNHHRDGSFGHHVLSFELILADGSRKLCSATENAELFRATIGGMGLTGIIGEVTLKLTPIETAAVSVKHYAEPDLEALFKRLEDEKSDDRYAVAWIDTLTGGRNMGRGVAMFGHHAGKAELPAGYEAGRRDAKPRAIPFDFPGWALNASSIALFNNAYYRREGAKGAFVSDYAPYFYPLDALDHWNRLYGKRGFVQYQCVIPGEAAFEGVKALLEAISQSGYPSFLAVLKRLGAQSSGLLSFPVAGYTLALDFPLRDDGLFAHLNRLDEITLQHGGRVYLAKDARLSAESFRAMYPCYPEWLRIKQSVDPENKFSSSLSRRLKIGEA